MAAGFSRRFGDLDKRTAGYNSVTLLRASYDNAARVFQDLVVALRPEDDCKQFGLAQSVDTIRCPHAHLGLGSSIADAVAEIAQRPAFASKQSLAILLGDMPQIAIATLIKLQQLASADGIVRPSWQGQPGHPVLFGRRFWPELALLKGDSGAAVVIKNHHQALLTVAVADPGVCFDIDTEADLR